MPTPDNDKTSAVKKAVDAFRARRAGETEPTPAEPTGPADDETSVIKIEPGQAPGGGDSDSPTKAFAIPTAAVGQDTDEVSLDEVTGDDAADADPAAPAPAGETAEDETLDGDEAGAGDESSPAADDAGEDEGDPSADNADEVTEDAADQDAADQDTADQDAGAENAGEAAADDESADEESAVAAAAAVAGAGGRTHETVVEIAGSGERAQPRARRAVEAVDPDEAERPAIVEQELTLSGGVEVEDDTVDVTAGGTDDDTTADDTTAADAETEAFEAATPEDSTEGGVGSTADVTPTEQIEVPTTELSTKGVAAAGAAAAAAAGAAGVAGAAGAAGTKDAGQEWSSTPHQPQVIPPAATATPEPERKSRRKLLWGALLVVAVVVAALLIWFFVFASSDQARAADAAETYQKAMEEGDLEALKNITCGEENAYYSSVSPTEFDAAFRSQQERNQMMSFKDVNGVAVDGDTARVGVDVYSTSDPNTTTSAQVTLHKVDGDWKVCTQP